MLARQFNLRHLFFYSALIAYGVPAGADEPVSPAEQRVFLSNHFVGLPPNVVLRYVHLRVGSLEPAREGNITVVISASAQQTGRLVHVEYVSGAEKVNLPDIDAAVANPVILFFLERDVREMQRMTGGQSAYFRKRVRMALAHSAQIRPVTFEFDGRMVSGDEITIRPYTDDPLKKRFERLAEKSYTFTLSNDVPGAVYRIHTAARAGQDASDAPPLIEETVTLSGVEP